MFFALPSSAQSQPQTGRTLARRDLLVGLAALGSAFPIAACHTTPARLVSVADHRRPGDPDDTAAAVRAMVATDALYFSAGDGSAPDGAYVVNALSLRSGVTVFGDGPRT